MNLFHIAERFNRSIRRYAMTASDSQIVDLRRDVEQLQEVDLTKELSKFKATNDHVLRPIVNARDVTYEDRDKPRLYLGPSPFAHLGRDVGTERYVPSIPRYAVLF